ncbi:MAG: polyprenyl synthetase family protein [Candidatus Omnitrophica bacterium]|nr:polyprenyl synthetase family protein [Candidatus Omnitrophota bacterium]
MLHEIKEQIDKSLVRFLDKIKIDYKLHLVDPILYNSIREFSLRDGKRIRPILLALSYKGYRKNSTRMSPSIYYASTCIELLHNFMLIHDDIIDRSDLRRGKPTLHRLLEKAANIPEKERLGQDLSLVAGDIVYALAIDAFLSINEELQRKERALKYFIQTAVFTAMGEFADTLHGVRGLNKVTEKDVFLNYTLKTARYTFDCPLVVGAILAGADNKDIKSLSKLGLLIGQAFQIQDDVIGIFDSEKNIGKSILSDLAESKKTILVCHAYRILKGKQKQEFLKIFTKNKKTYADLVAIRKIFIQAGSLTYSLKQINTRLIHSLELLRKLKMAPKYKKLIEKCLFQLFKHSEIIATQFATTAR